MNKAYFNQMYDASRLALQQLAEVAEAAKMQTRGIEFADGPEWFAELSKWIVDHRPLFLEKLGWEVRWELAGLHHYAVHVGTWTAMSVTEGVMQACAHLMTGVGEELGILSRFTGEDYWMYDPLITCPLIDLDTAIETWPHICEFILSERCGGPIPTRPTFIQLWKEHRRILDLGESNELRLTKADVVSDGIEVWGEVKFDTREMLVWRGDDRKRAVRISGPIQTKLFRLLWSERRRETSWTALAADVYEGQYANRCRKKIDDLAEHLNEKIERVGIAVVKNQGRWRLELKNPR